MEAYAQVVPMEDINLHFTGDFHAIGTAHNLLSALVDNSIYWGSDIALDSRRVSWRRVVDMNDRALRQIVCSLGGVSNGFARESGFDITVASEIMAIFCLAENLQDLERRLGDIIVGYRRDRSSVTANELKGNGPMTVLLKDAFAPNVSRHWRTIQLLFTADHLPISHMVAILLWRQRQHSN